MSGFFYIKLSCLIVCSSLWACHNALNQQFESIHPPVGLIVEEVSSPFVGHRVSFFSENRETRFSGYRIYVQDTREAAVEQQIQEFSANPSFAPTTGWCSIQINSNFLEQIAIQVSTGGITQGYDCQVNDLTLTSGFFLAVRAGVNRDCQSIRSENCFPWSGAAVVQIP